MNVTKQTLGQGYVVGAGVVLSGALLAHAYVALDQSLTAALVALAGLVPALGLVGAHYWLPRSGLEGNQIWTLAEWVGLGIALLTLVNVGLLMAEPTLGVLVPVMLAASVAMAAFVGILVGAMIELRWTTRRLSRSNDVLNRVLRHNLRNDLNVVMGHLSAIEPAVSGPTQDRVEEMGLKVEDILSTIEKARQIDTALAASRRRQQPLDMIPILEKRIRTIERANPSAEIETDLPEESWVEADWFLGTALENIIENGVDHADGEPTLHVSVTNGPRTVCVSVRDRGPEIPDTERSVLESGRETPLRHSQGVGLWLVQLVVESYDGRVSIESSEEGEGNEVVLELPAASSPFERGLVGRLHSEPARSPSRS